MFVVCAFDICQAARNARESRTRARRRARAGAPVPNGVRQNRYPRYPQLAARVAAPAAVLPAAWKRSAVVRPLIKQGAHAQARCARARSLSVTLLSFHYRFIFTPARTRTCRHSVLLLRTPCRTHTAPRPDQSSQVTVSTISTRVRYLLHAAQARTLAAACRLFAGRSKHAARRRACASLLRSTALSSVTNFPGPVARRARARRARTFRECVARQPGMFRIRQLWQTTTRSSDVIITTRAG